jgi:hypothetical protein
MKSEKIETERFMKPNQRRGKEGSMIAVPEQVSLTLPRR